MSEVILSDLTVNSVWVCRQHRNRQLKRVAVSSGCFSRYDSSCILIKQFESELFCSILAIKDIALVQ